jgi:hypothetical protein
VRAVATARARPLASCSLACPPSVADSADVLVRAAPAYLARRLRASSSRSRPSSPTATSRSAPRTCCARARAPTRSSPSSTRCSAPTSRASSRRCLRARARRASRRVRQAHRAARPRLSCGGDSQALPRRATACGGCERARVRGGLCAAVATRGTVDQMAPAP